MRSEFEGALGEVLGGPVEDLQRLSGGASRETWSLTCAGRRLVVQRERAGAGAGRSALANEAALLTAAASAGVPAPPLVVDATGPDLPLGAPAIVTGFVEGETIPRRILSTPALARPDLARECGSILAAIHHIPPEAAPGLRGGDQLGELRATFDLLGEPHPALELGFRWLDHHRPSAPPAEAVVHGDFRMGNLLITPAGVAAVLDWELAHLGDPIEDLGWFCVRAWRFGNDDRPAGGVGSRNDLWLGYAQAGGAEVDPDAARWWETYGTLRWAVICMVQAAAHLHGLTRSVELAAIGRRTCESEHDLLALLPGGQAPPSPTPAGEGHRHGPHDRPTAPELLEAVEAFLRDDVAGATEGRVRFHTKVAANVVAMVARELRLGPALADAHAERLDALGYADEAALGEAIRRGDLDDRWDEVHEAVWATVRDKLAVAHPGWDGS